MQEIRSPQPRPFAPRLLSLAFGLGLGLCAGCASNGSKPPLEMTPKASAQLLGDPAPLRPPPGTLPFDEMRKGPSSIALNTQQVAVGEVSFYFLRLIVGNRGPGKLEEYLDVSVLDSAGLSVPPIEKEDVLRYALTLAEGQEAKVGGNHVATAAGAAAPVAALAGAGPAAQGLGLLAFLSRAADSPDDTRREGAALARWALDHWLPNQISLEATERQTGILVFAAPQRRPLQIRAKLGAETFVFHTE